MRFKSCIKCRSNGLMNEVHQGLISAKNEAYKIWNATITTKKTPLNNPQVFETMLHAISPFATAFISELEAIKFNSCFYIQ